MRKTCGRLNKSGPHDLLHRTINNICNGMNIEMINAQVNSSVDFKWPF